MLKLRWLRIERFKNVLPGTKIEFSDGFNVLLGQNGTGKTTLLELISSVVRCDFGKLQGEDFAIEYEMAAGEVVIRVSLRNRRQEVSDLPGRRKRGGRAWMRASSGPTARRPCCGSRMAICT